MNVNFMWVDREFWLYQLLEKPIYCWDDRLYFFISYFACNPTKSPYFFMLEIYIYLLLPPKKKFYLNEAAYLLLKVRFFQPEEIYLCQKEMFCNSFYTSVLFPVNSSLVSRYTEKWKRKVMVGVLFICHLHAFQLIKI